MARQRIGDASTNLNFGSVQHNGCHIDVGLTPDEVRVTDPNMAKAQFLGELGQMDYFWQRLRRKKPDAEFKIAHPISSFNSMFGLRLVPAAVSVDCVRRREFLRR